MRCIAARWHLIDKSAKRTAAGAGHLGSWGLPRGSFGARRCCPHEAGAIHRRPGGRTEVAQASRRRRARKISLRLKRCTRRRGQRQPFAPAASCEDLVGPPRGGTSARNASPSPPTALPIRAAPESAAGERSAPACPPGPGGRSSRPAPDRRRARAAEIPGSTPERSAASPASRRIAVEFDRAQPRVGASTSKRCHP